MGNRIVDIHADDYAYTLNTSKDMLELMNKGYLQSFSIIPNTSYFSESIELLYKEIPKMPFLPLISVHLNFVEGMNLSNTPLLSRNGINNNGWGTLLIASLGGLKKDLKEQLKKEIKAQIFKTNEVITNCIEIAEKSNIKVSQKGLRIDSHTHTHAIPLVFDALKEVIEEEKLNVEYIRNPKEPISPFVFSLNNHYRPINFVKNIILNIFSGRIDKYCKKKNLKKDYLWGLVMSGEMDYTRIQKLYLKLVYIANRNNRDLEILFHPGLALKEEYLEDLNKEYYKDFNSANNRCIEKESVIKLNNLIEE